MRMPSANHVAWAIVAACRETGDDPFAVAGREKVGPSKRTSIRARHYALHALLEVFPDLAKRDAADKVGAPGDPIVFYYNSYHSVAKTNGSGRRFVNWWDETAYQRIITAICDAGPGVEWIPMTEDSAAEPPEARALVKLSAAVGSIVEPTRPAAVPGKRKLEDMLRDAVRNTQRMTPPPEN